MPKEWRRSDTVMSVVGALFLLIMSIWLTGITTAQSEHETKIAKCDKERSVIKNEMTHMHDDIKEIQTDVDSIMSTQNDVRIMLERRLPRPANQPPG